MLAAQEVVVQGIRHSSGDTSKVAGQGAKATKGEWRLNSRGVSHLEDAGKTVTNGTTSIGREKSVQKPQKFEILRGNALVPWQQGVVVLHDLQE